MISKICIKNLFGRFDYDIITKLGGITIITGPNGFGKSTILQIINALSKGNVEYFLQLDFSSLVIEFDGNYQTEIKKTKQELEIDGINIDGRKIDDIQFNHITSRMKGIPIGFFDRHTDEWISNEGSSYYIPYMNSLYLDIFSNESRKKTKKIREKLDEIRSLCGNVRLITDQRLIRTAITRSDEQQVIDVICELPQRLKAQISKVSEEYSSVANNLDSTYPKRLFAAKDGIDNQSEYEAYLKDANEKFKKLSNYNLVKMSFIDEKDYNQKYSTALKIYFDDFAKKYKVFQDLIAKLDLFTKIINNRLTFKQIRITRDEGFQVVDAENPQKVLQLTQLSSGEKQEIVLFYELIFDTPEGLLLLIDEPEISLHIAWQKQFLDDLVEVSKQTAVQVIVATHSPQIVSKHLDLQIDLGELYGN